METVELEEWREIAGSVGYYVSNLGRVKSPSKILKPIPDAGYYFVRIALAGGPKIMRLSGLVMAAFVGPRPRAHFIRYHDENAQNCALANLYYEPRSPSESKPSPTRTRRRAVAPVLKEADQSDPFWRTRPTVQPKFFTGKRDDFRNVWSASPLTRSLRMEGRIAHFADVDGREFSVEPGDWFAACRGRIVVVKAKTPHE